MSRKKAKIKKNKNDIWKMSPHHISRYSTCVMFATATMTLVLCWPDLIKLQSPDERIKYFAESCAALMREKRDGRASAREIIADCKEMTGIDVENLVLKGE